MTDLNAVDSTDIRVKLRFGPSNGKLQRSPMNILAAITALTSEYADLMGIADAAYEVSSLANYLYASDRNMKAAPTPEQVMAAAIEAIINMPMKHDPVVGKRELPAEARAKLIVSELRDMELID